MISQSPQQSAQKFLNDLSELGALEAFLYYRRKDLSGNLDRPIYEAIDRCLTWCNTLQSGDYWSKLDHIVENKMPDLIKSAHTVRDLYKYIGDQV
jgi:hypothetical protein